MATSKVREKTQQRLTSTEWDVLTHVFSTPEFQGLIGSDDWDLTEAEEAILWHILKKLNITQEH